MRRVACESLFERGGELVRILNNVGGAAAEITCSRMPGATGTSRRERRNSIGWCRLRVTFVSNGTQENYSSAQCSVIDKMEGQTNVLLCVVVLRQRRRCNLRAANEWDGLGMDAGTMFSRGAIGGAGGCSWR